MNFVIFSRVVLFALVTALLIGQAKAQDRHALLIGNASYETSVGALKNPLNDVDLVGTALASIGFAVTIVKDAGRLEFLRAVDRHASRLRRAGPDAIGFVYYSGHGFADAKSSKNYLVPIDVRDFNDRTRRDSIELGQIVEMLKSRAPTSAHFLVLDSCRNNLGGSSPGSRGIPAAVSNALGSALRNQVESTEDGLITPISSRGFVKIEPSPGVFISYSTEPGGVASDHGAGASAFAAAVASEIVKPGQSHLDVFHNVRVAVARATNRSQVPWTNDGLLTKVFFAGQNRNERSIIASRSGVRRSREPDQTISVKEVQTLPQVKPGNCKASGDNSEIPKCIALLIGNKSYKDKVGRLDHPHDDVEHLQGALKILGFEVMQPVLDADSGDKIRLAIADYVERLNKAGEGALGFFYFSGHGIAISKSGPNYLLPTNLPNTRSAIVRALGVEVNRDVLDHLAAGAANARHFVVIDACRDRLKAGVKDKGLIPGRDRSITDIEQRKGMLIALATAPGQTAKDNGHYAKALSKNLLIAGKDHDSVFKAVRKKVMDATKDDQKPEVRDGLTEQIFFAGQRRINTTTVAVTQVSSADAIDQRLQALTDAIKSGNSILVRIVRDSEPKDSPIRKSAELWLQLRSQEKKK